jgi:hypothetical protein
MLQPQSDLDVRPVEADLQALDRFLYLAWQPRARIVRPGSYDPYGVPIPPTYEGRWEVRRRTEMGEDQLIWQVAWEAGEDGHTQGDYRAVGPWLVAKMRRWDQALRAEAEAYRAKLWAEHDAAELAEQMLNEEEAREFLEEQATRFDDKKGGHFTGATLT